MEYDSLTDEEVVIKIRRGDSAAMDFLIHKYKRIVKNKAYPFFLAGSDSEDVIQEGMIGLYKAIREFEPDKSDSFYAFADLCILRQIYTAIRLSQGKKHIPLNSYVPLSAEGEESGYDVADSPSPEDIVIGQEEEKDMKAHIESVLSRLECLVLAYYLQGKSYAEIAKLTDKGVKTVDNAIQRIRRKVEKLITEEN